MLQPKKTKYRKLHRGRSALKGISLKGATLAFGRYGIKATSASELTARQIESARRTMTRAIKRGGKIWIRVFPHKAVTSKASDAPMGKGKGAPDRFVAVVKPGRIIFEMECQNEELAQKALKLASYKLPVKTKIISKQ